MNLEIKKDYLLSKLTSFHTGGPAKFFCEVKNTDFLLEAFEFAKNNNLKVLILGGGNNILVSDEGFDGLVIRICIQGVKITEETDTYVKLQVGAGMNWDDFVAEAVQKKLWGIENLSHIPGSVGALAVQNVGAYGCEASQVIDSVNVYDRADHKLYELKAIDCEFSYRSSIFNGKHKDRYVILSIVFKLLKNSQPCLDYPDLQKWLKENNITSPSLSMIREAIISIRNNKLPLPSLIGNAGSFFKNLYVSELQLNNLIERAINEKSIYKNKLIEFQQKFFDKQNRLIKIPTAFLIESCGLKGFCLNNGACVHENHALVLVNRFGKATTHDIMSLFQYIRQSVYREWGVEIVNEPELVGFTEGELAKYFYLV